jgi:hypothetical protein
VSEEAAFEGAGSGAWSDWSGAWSNGEFIYSPYDSIEDIGFYPSALDSDRFGLLLIVDRQGAASVVVDAGALEASISDMRDDRAFRLEESARHNEPPEDVYLDTYCAGNRLWQRVRGWPEDWTAEPPIIAEARGYQARGWPWGVICLLTERRYAFAHAMAERVRAEMRLERERDAVITPLSTVGLDDVPQAQREELEKLEGSIALADSAVHSARAEYRSLHNAMTRYGYREKRREPAARTSSWDDLVRKAEDATIVDPGKGFTPLTAPEADLVFGALGHLRAQRFQEDSIDFYDIGFEWDDEGEWWEERDALLHEAQEAAGGINPGVQSAHLGIVVGALRLAAREIAAGSLTVNLGEHGFAAAAQAWGLVDRLSGHC